MALGFVILTRNSDLLTPSKFLSLPRSNSSPGPRVHPTLKEDNYVSRGVLLNCEFQS